MPRVPQLKHPGRKTFMPHQGMQGAQPVGHHAWDCLQGLEPLLVTDFIIGVEKEVPDIPIAS